MKGFFYSGLLNVLVLVVVVLLTGCSGDSSLGLDYNFKQGIAEIEVNSLNNAPPERIFQNSGFKVILALSNNQAYDVSQGVVTLVGIDEKYFKINPAQQTFTAVGRSLTNPGGDKIFLEFDGESGELFQNAEQYGNPYFIKIRYASRMEFADTICINPNLYTVYDAGCTTEHQKSYGGQGAPLAVTNLEQVIYPSGSGASVEFRLQVENRGRGQVGFVNFGRGELGGKKMDCTFQGKGLIDKQRVEFGEKQQQTVLVCKTFLADQHSYETALAVDFTYDYLIREQQTLHLVK